MAGPWTGAIGVVCFLGGAEGCNWVGRGGGRDSDLHLWILSSVLGHGAGKPSFLTMSRRIDGRAPLLHGEGTSALFSRGAFSACSVLVGCSGGRLAAVVLLAHGQHKIGLLVHWLDQ